MKLEQWFSAPVALDRLNFDTDINDQIKSYILDAEKSSKERNHIPTQQVRDDLFESQWDLYQRDEASLQTLKKAVFERLLYLVTKLNNYNQQVADSLEINEQTWFHVTRKGGYFTAHNHPMASWSAVYCVDEGEFDSGQDSGVTRFLHPYSQANYYIDAGNASMTNPFNCAAMNIKLRTGDLIFFPSYLLHEVTPYVGEGTRITIASNFWIESKLINVRA